MEAVVPSLLETRHVQAPSSVHAAQSAATVARLQRTAALEIVILVLVARQVTQSVPWDSAAQFRRATIHAPGLSLEDAAAQVVIAGAVRTVKPPILALVCLRRNNHDGGVL
jgi:hypothetical protein